MLNLVLLVVAMHVTGTTSLKFLFITLSQQLRLLFGLASDPSDSKTRTTTSRRFSQYYVVRAREPASFWRENVTAVFCIHTSYIRLLYLSSDLQCSP